MLVTFSSDAYENLTFFGDIAQQLLKLMGHSATVPGALKAEEVPNALNNLKTGLLKQGDTPTNQSAEDEPVVNLSHRAIPLIGMLEAAAKKNCNVLWN
ncbi:DUF1840 domain-containing protein [Legionella dresdenensis]|uniref:DUF1840 domain-containing protein n=1 Tax=Legionella dresdenensis TaxID=450200 RepID=A0ABV8CED9_9GAMM